MKTTTHRNISRFLALSLLILFSVLLFTACGTSDAEKKFIVKRHLTEASMEGITMTGEQMAS